MTEAVTEGGGAEASPRRRGFGTVMLVMAVLLLVISILIVAAGPVGYRIGTLDLGTATVGVARNALIAAIGAGVCALAGGVASLTGRRPRGVIVAILIVTAALMIGFRAYSFQIDHDNLPPIHDVQTDWSAPVAFSAEALRVREASGGTAIRDDARVGDGYGRWVGIAFAEAQASVYDLAPLSVNVPPDRATGAVEAAARRLGWTVTLTDPATGRVEATTASQWYGIGADIAVRIVAEGAGSRIDVRSANRVAGPDMGANARRIKTLLDDTAFALRGQ